MAKPDVLVLRAPGTNCDAETAYAFQLAGANTQRLHVNRLLDQPKLCEQFQILCIPGGFSYGDDVAAGRILGNQVQHHLAEQMADFKSADKLILGICNGFQVLMKSGVLLDTDPQAGPPATLTWNDSGKFEDRWVRLGVEGHKSVFLRGIESMYLPVAHAEGKFVAHDEAAFDSLQSAGQLVLRYLPLDAEAAEVAYPDNPNGSVGHVAGVCDTTGRVLGLMPHPERHVDPTHHPRWTRNQGAQEGDGLTVFHNAVEYFA